MRSGVQNGRETGMKMLSQPLLFQPNRVWRCYTGGALLDRFLGVESPADGNFPEEWLASTTTAVNGARQQNAEEGLSRIRLADGSDGPLLRDLIAADPRGCLGPGADSADGLGVLCKFLDSSIRLPIQCHPDRAFARRHYNSEHGKTESWFILDGRPVDGEDPYLLLGFKPHVTKEAFRRAVEAEDMAAVVDMFHRVPAKPGDSFHIPGRLPHAIGAGVFLLEVQEPTDWVVQPEHFVGSTELSHTDMWGPLTPDVGFECFDYEGAASREQILSRLRLVANPVQKTDGGLVENLIGPHVTDCFRVDRLTVTDEVTYMPDAPFQVAVITEGTGYIDTGDEPQQVHRGDTVFLSNSVNSVSYRTESVPLGLFVITPGTA